MILLEFCASRFAKIHYRVYQKYKPGTECPGLHYASLLLYRTGPPQLPIMNRVTSTIAKTKFLILALLTGSTIRYSRGRDFTSLPRDSNHCRSLGIKTFRLGLTIYPMYIIAYFIKKCKGENLLILQGKREKLVPDRLLTGCRIDRRYRRFLSYLCLLACRQVFPFSY